MDIISPAIWGSGRVQMVDLDLDLWVNPDGELLILDEDEFQENQVSRAYPERLIIGAELAVREVHAMLSLREEPFGTVAEGWFQRGHGAKH